MLLHLETWPAVEDYLRRSRGIVVPIGSTEQHGPNGLIGTDAICAEVVARGLGEAAEALVAPTIAVGMAQHLAIMVTAMIIAVAIMLVFAGQIGEFVERHPTMKMLALSFLILIGVTLVAEGLGKHIEKGYIYFAMAFSFVVEILNMRIRRAREAPVALHHRFESEDH